MSITGVSTTVLLILLLSQPQCHAEHKDDNVTILWSKSKSNEGAPLPSILGIDFFLPEAISRIERGTVVISPASPYCTGTSYVAIFDDRGDPLIVSIENFLHSDFIRSLAREAKAPEAEWEWAVINRDPSGLMPKDLRKGNGFPGKRATPRNESSLTAITRRCLAPILERLDPAFPMRPERMVKTATATAGASAAEWTKQDPLPRMRQTQSLFGLIVPYTDRGAE